MVLVLIAVNFMEKILAWLGLRIHELAVKLMYMNQPSPFFSIVIPCLNEEKYLPRLLKDLSKQSFTDFEVIVVDGQSEDKTVSKAKEFTELNLRVVTSTTRHVSYQRNLGAKQAQAEWLIFFDADNQLPHFFLEGVKYNLTKKETDSFTTYIKPDTRYPQDKAIANIANIGIVASISISQPAAFGAMIGVKKKVFNKVKGFDEQINFQEDMEFVRRVMKAGYKFRIYQDPYIFFSFRRFRREGTLNMIRKFTKLQLNSLTKSQLSPETEYPMLGGSYYEQNKNKASLARFALVDKNIRHLISNNRDRFRRVVQKVINYD